jgi:hypothetical protein
MLTIWGSGYRPLCNGLTRRDFLSVGTLALGGISLADLLRNQAPAAERKHTPKSVIMVYLPGGPSHIDLYDMKPDAPVEIRGEFKHAKTNVPGIDLCELMPLQAKIADKLSIIRGFQTAGGHDSRILTTGFGTGVRRPAFGSVVCKVSADRGDRLPPYVSLVQETNLPFGEDPAYLGPAHAPFSFRGAGLANLSLTRGMTPGRLAERKELLRSFDAMRRGVDARRASAGLDPFTSRALDIICSGKARAAFDLNREPLLTRERYGTSPGTQQFLLARRLVEAGVRVVTLCGGWVNDGEGDSSSNLSNWDTHENNFERLRKQAPRLDHALYTLISDLHQRGLDKDVVVVACGEMGRSPRVGKPNDGGSASSSGRDHWETGFALVSGGGLRMGQVVGETDRHGGRARGRPITPQNLLATLYYLLGIDPVRTFPDHNGRPQYLLDDRERIGQLL